MDENKFEPSEYYRQSHGLPPSPAKRSTFWSNDRMWARVALYGMFITSILMCALSIKIGGGAGYAVLVFFPAALSLLIAIIVFEIACIVKRPKR